MWLIYCFRLARDGSAGEGGVGCRPELVLGEERWCGGEGDKEGLGEEREMECHKLC